MPTDYAGMSETMRVADLTSRNPAIVLSLLRAAPQALTQLHEGESGIDILVRTRMCRRLLPRWTKDLSMTPCLRKAGCDHRVGRRPKRRKIVRSACCPDQGLGSECGQFPPVAWRGAARRGR